MEQDTTINQSPTSEVKTTPKQPNFLITLLSILLLISCLIAGFFAYQTQKLVKELTVYNLQSEETPIATSSPDPVVDWKAYTNSELVFSFKIAPILKYPEVIVPSQSNSFSNREGISSPLELTEGDILLESTVYTNIDETSLKKVEVALSSNTGDILDQPFQPVGSIKKIKNLENGGSIFEESPISPKEANYYIAIWKNNTNIHVLKMFAMKDILNKSKTSFEQMAISYTFTSSLNQVACTMEAKICPDGSAVGRSGPKCEFAPCPTIKPVSTSPQL